MDLVHHSKLFVAKLLLWDQGSNTMLKNVKKEIAGWHRLPESVGSLQPLLNSHSDVERLKEKKHVKKYQCQRRKV